MLCSEMLYGSSIAGCEADGTTLRTNTSAEESGDSFSQAQESHSDNCSLQNQSATPSITRVPSQVVVYALMLPAHIAHAVHKNNFSSNLCAFIN